MRLILNIEPTQPGRVRIEVRTVEPEVSLSWQEITLPMPNMAAPMVSLSLPGEVWAAVRREGGSGDA